MILGTCLGCCSNDHVGPSVLFRSKPVKITVRFTMEAWNWCHDNFSAWIDGNTKREIHFFCPFSGCITFSQFQFSKRNLQTTIIFQSFILSIVLLDLHQNASWISWSESSSTSSCLSFPTRDLSVSLVFDNAMSQLAIARAHRLCCRTAVAGVAGLVLGGERCSKSHPRFCHGCHLGLVIPRYFWEILKT